MLKHGVFYFLPTFNYDLLVKNEGDRCGRKCVAIHHYHNSESRTSEIHPYKTFTGAVSGSGDNHSVPAGVVCSPRGLCLNFGRSYCGCVNRPVPKVEHISRLGGVRLPCDVLRLRESVSGVVWESRGPVTGGRSGRPADVRCRQHSPTRGSL